MIISLEPNVGYTSNQTVNLNVSVVYRDVSKEMSIWTMEGPWRALFHQLSPKISLAGSILGVHLGVHEGPGGSL